MEVREGSVESGLHLNIKTEVMTTERYTALTYTVKTAKLLKILLTWVPSSDQVETEAKKQREG